MKAQITLLTIALGLTAVAHAATQTPEPPSRPTAAAQEHKRSQVATGDRKFLQLAIDSGAKELQLSERARQKAQSAAVKAFAKLMVEDHSKSNRELLAVNEKLLRGGGVPYKRVSSAVRKDVKQLDTLSGADFDRRYMEIMVEDHKANVALFERQAKRGRDAELKTLAQKLLPTLRRHLQMAREIAADLKTP